MKKAVIKKSDLKDIKEKFEIKKEENTHDVIEKSFDDICDDIIEKANNYGRKIPIKKQTKDGRMITYWINPEDLNEGEMKGQQSLFGDEEMNRLDQQEAGENDFYNNWDSETYEFRIKPLVREMSKADKSYPGLSKRIENKYANYMWDRDTRDLDIELDFETLEFMMKSEKDPENKEYYYADFLAKTQRLSKKLNNRKKEMARLKVKAEVKYKGEKAIVTKFSERGYPTIKLANGEQRKVFIDEIIDIDELIEKYGRAA